MYYNNNEKKLLYKIEHCRIKMHKLTSSYPLHAKEVVIISQKLDCLLNEYDIFRKRKTVTK